MRVLRVYHGGRNVGHLQRERALCAAGVELALVVPRSWPGGAEALPPQPFPVTELAVRRAGDVNRHRYVSEDNLRRVVREFDPDMLDVHEEPFSIAGRQWIEAAPHGLPIVMYTAQNVDKRLPQPFAAYERRAHRRVAALYPCSRQAAAVARGKGFDGVLEVIPLGIDPALFRPGAQALDDDELVLALFGRLVPEKGVRDAVEVLARVHAARPTRLFVVGSGPEEGPARARAAELGVSDRLQIEHWLPPAETAEIFRRAHVVLVPSTPTTTWTEQFGRVIVEAQASGAVVAGYASGSIPEVAGDAALLVRPGDVSALAAAVGRVTADGAAYRALREAGLRLSASRSWQRVAEQQAALYRTVVSGEYEAVALPRSPRRRREVARAEFGCPAPTTAGLRPFALPVLRRGGAVADVLAAAIDAAAELRAFRRA